MRLPNICFDDRQGDLIAILIDLDCIEPDTKSAASHTWHGILDMRVRGSSVLVGNAEEGEVEVEVAEGYNAVELNALLPLSEAPSMWDNSTTVEAKTKFNNGSHISQVVKTCVTSSFVEANLCKDLEPMVPTIIIDMHTFRVFFYNCTEDILLISKSISLGSRQRMDRSSLFLLWVVLNHRRYFKPLSQMPKIWPWCKSSILDKMGEYISHYRGLASRNVNWNSHPSHPLRRTFSDLESGGLHLEDLDESTTPKKIRLEPTPS